jgi:hypothetical protein
MLMLLQQGHAAVTYSMIMQLQHEHAVWTCSKACSVDMRAGPRSMDLAKKKMFYFWEL